MAKTGKCKACDNLVSKTAKFCPHCGEKKPYKNSSSGTWFLFVILFLLIIAALGEDDNEKQEYLSSTHGEESSHTTSSTASPVFNSEELWIIKKRAEKRDPDALYLLSYTYSNPYGIVTGSVNNPYLSLRLMEEAAQLGQPDAQYGLSLHYSIGEGVPKNYAIAFDLTKKAAASGKPSYISMLASYYSRGKGVSQNNKIANELLITSADQGFGVSQAILATYYRSGQNGLKKDYIQAYKWHTLAKMTGHPGGGATGFRGLSFDELLAEEMSHEEIERAEFLVKEWLMKNPEFPIEDDPIREVRELYQKVKARDDAHEEQKNSLYNHR